MQDIRRAGYAGLNDTNRAEGFPPLARADARILILGSLPGQRSIDVNEYYAHAQNCFWRIMSELLGASGSYTERCEQLLRSKIALWDVLASSVRPGSLDADIRLETAQTNDFVTFLDDHEAISLILFNGRKAAQIFERKVLVSVQGCEIRRQTMPSTSPAYAAMSFADKLRFWRAAIV
jgi:TDG/mug DNA glycosylase family protein